MSRFRFKLDPVLKARRHAEQAQQRALAELQRERIALEDVLRMHQQQIDQSRGTMRDELVGSISTLNLRSHAAATMRLMARAQSLALELAAVHKRIETARSQLLAATRDRRAIELLRDQRYAHWKAAQNKREHDAMDELAVTSAARRKTRERML